jgi:hypothetical protein
MPPIEHLVPEEEIEKLSTLQLVDLISHKLAIQGNIPMDMTLLRRRIEEMENSGSGASAVEIERAVDKLRARSSSRHSAKLPKGRALVCVNGTDYVCNVDPSVLEVSGNGQSSVDE